MSDTQASRILQAWIELEAALRNTLPACAVAPPNQPSELLAALRINGLIDQEDEALIRVLREERNRVAHALEEPDQSEADAYHEAVDQVKEKLRGAMSNCG